MRKIIAFWILFLLAATGCEHDALSTDPENTTSLKDPALAWSAGAFEATIGTDNIFPTLTNACGVHVTYESSQPEVAVIDERGAITLASGGSALIKASSAADNTYAASSASYLLTVLSPSGGESGDSGLAYASTGDSSSDDDISNTKFKGKITITYSDHGDASVTGDSYGYVTVDGNKVTVNNTGGEVLVYELTGTTSDGFFKAYGTKKQAIVLNGVSITNPDGAALNNQNKKRTFIVVKGKNMLSDSSSASYDQVEDEDQKAVLFSESQLIFSGGGLLTVHALNNQDKSAIASDDYIRLMHSPTVKVNAGSGAGHGFKGKDYVMLSAGTLAVSVAGPMKKGISTDDYVLVEGGTHIVTVTGGVAWDDEDAEYSGSAGIKADHYFAMAGGTLVITNTGDGGKGIKAGSYDYDEENHSLSDCYISGGTLSVTTSGGESQDVSPKCIKIGWVTKDGDGDRARVTGYAGNLLVSGGSVTVNSSCGEGLEVKGDLSFAGGETCVTSTGDDAVNCQGDMTVSNGFIYAFSSANDAMDSNGDTWLNGGYLMAVCTRGVPEEALDASFEDGKRVRINEGVTLVVHGRLEMGSVATQPLYTMTGSAGAWNVLHDGDSCIAAFKAPANLSEFIVSAPSLSEGYVDVCVGGVTRCNGVWAFDGVTGGTAVSLSEYTRDGFGFWGRPGGPGGR